MGLCLWGSNGKGYDMYQKGDPKMIGYLWIYIQHILLHQPLLLQLLRFILGLFERVAQLESYWEESLHSLKGLNHVIDVRNLGLVGGIEMYIKMAKLDLEDMIYLKRFS